MIQTTNEMNIKVNITDNRVQNSQDKIDDISWVIYCWITIINKN